MCGCLSCILYWGSRSGTLGTPCPVACVAPSPSMGPELGAMRLDAPGDLPPTSFFSPPCHLPGVHSPSNPYLGFVCLCCEHVCAPASLWGCPEERALCGRGQLDPRGSHLQSPYTGGLSPVQDHIKDTLKVQAGNKPDSRAALDRRGLSQANQHWERYLLSGSLEELRCGK